MRIINVLGSSAFEKGRIVEGLVGALRTRGFSVSVVKRVPDGFDIDQPGKGSYEKRKAGAREVMLANRERFALLRESDGTVEPDLEALVGRLDPVDVVVAEGFHGAPVPTIEAFRPSRGREARWPTDGHVIAIVSDEPIDAPLPVFPIEDTASLAGFLALRLALRSG